MRCLAPAERAQAVEITKGCGCLGCKTVLCGTFPQLSTVSCKGNVDIGRTALISFGIVTCQWPNRDQLTGRPTAVGCSGTAQNAWSKAKAAIRRVPSSPLGQSCPRSTAPRQDETDRREHVRVLDDGWR